MKKAGKKLQVANPKKRPASSMSSLANEVIEASAAQHEYPIKNWKS